MTEFFRNQASSFAANPACYNQATNMMNDYASQYYGYNFGSGASHNASDNQLAAYGFATAAVLQ